MKIYILCHHPRKLVSLESSSGSHMKNALHFPYASFSPKKPGSLSPLDGGQAS